MGTNMNCYNTLFENMKRKFTVSSGDCHYSLGAYMRMKANEETHEASLPVTVERKPAVALVSIREFVNEKLAVKAVPSPEKILKRFPMRTSLAACLSALAICTILFSGAILGSSVIKNEESAESFAFEYTQQIDEPVEDNTANA